MKLGIPIYEGVNLLDVSGALEMFYWAGRKHDLETVLVSLDGRSVTSMNGVRFEPHASFVETPLLDVLWVPGGNPNVLEAIMKDLNSPYLQYLRQIATGAGRPAGRVCGDDALGLRRMPATLSRNQGRHHPPTLRRLRQPADRGWYLVGSG